MVEMKRKVLIFDPFAGISGDMILGALVDLGLDGAWLQQFVAGLGLGEIKVNIERAKRRGIDSGRVYFDLPHEHAHRHLKHVIEIINRSNASDVTKARAIDAFTLLAKSEAEVHGTTIEKVHFHEVGALDAILDVLCAMAAIEQLGFEEFFTRPVAVGHGWVNIEHGRFPVPAPATLKLLEGISLTGTELPGECTTPTGAAILQALTNGKPAPNAFRATRSSYGAGTRDPDDRPNVLRLIACEIEPAADTLYVIQADVDDLASEYVPAAQDALLRAGALDAVISNVAMKKGRPGHRFEALVPVELLDRVLEALFATTTTIGARYWAVQRPALPRTETEIEWRGQRIRRKEVQLPDGTVRSKAEYEDVLRAAEALGISALEVRRAVDTITGGR
jgi:pyridinium-3,5-bisthiocarboxylic acid mononucleotide nickel chelatase